MDIKVSIPFAELRNENDREYVVRITVRELDFSRTRTHDQQFGWLVGWLVQPKLGRVRPT